jgi:ABC-type xylose transport system permease subunit
MIWSFGAPIAVIEACVPSRAFRPWLGWAGLTVVAALYVLAAIVVFRDQMNTEQFLAAPAQLAVTAAIAVVLAVAAFAVPHRSTPAPGWVPPPWLVACGAAVAFVIHQVVPSTWPGVAIDVLVLTLLGALALYWSRRAARGERHVLALAGAALVVSAALSFLVEPLGNPAPAVKHSVNAALTLGVLTLLAWAFRRLRRGLPAAACPAGLGASPLL